MVKDCIVKIYDVYDGDNKKVADDMRALLNKGYKVTLDYSAGNAKSVMLTAIAEEEEKLKAARSTKSTKKDTE